MTHPNPKDPQADIGEAIDDLVSEYLYGIKKHLGKHSEAAELARTQIKAQLLQLFQAHQQELLTELLEAKKLYITELAWKHAASEEAVPVEILNRKIGELNG